MPDPCGPDDLVQLRVIRRPAQLSNCLFRAGHQNRGVSGAARMDLGGNWMPSHAASRFDHLPHTESLSVSQVEDQPVLGRRVCFQGRQSQKMGIGNVGDVDVVANAGPISSRVVIPIDPNRSTATQGHVQDPATLK